MFGAEDCASCRGARTPSMAGRDAGVSLYLVEIVEDGAVVKGRDERPKFCTMSCSIPATLRACV